MYDVAMSVLSCLRAGTDVHVAWLISPEPTDPREAVALTPGGGRIGALMGGALDSAITDAVRGLDTEGRLTDVQLGPVEALISGKTEGATVGLAVIPGRLLPVDLWEDLVARKPIGFSLQVDGTRLAEPERLDPGTPGVERTDDRLVTQLAPVTRAVLSGGGPIAQALADGFAMIGWEPAVYPDVATATGVMATLAQIDVVVVMGHDVETSGRALQAAIESGAGYIGSIGSPRMQDQRRDWLAYRGVDWDDRVRGPAGFPIGAETPAEIAVSIVAEAIAALRGVPNDQVS